MVWCMFTAPEDFAATSGTLTVTEDGSVECVTITLSNDDKDEDNRECFAFAISANSSEGVSLDTSQATICITDDDGKLTNQIK